MDSTAAAIASPRRGRAFFGWIGSIVLIGVLAGLLAACSDDDAASPDSSVPFPAFAALFGDEVPEGEVIGLVGVEPDALPDGYSGLSLEPAEVADAAVAWLVHGEDATSDVSAALDRLGDRLEEVARADGLVLASLAPVADGAAETSSTTVADASGSADAPDAPDAPDASASPENTAPSDSPLFGTVTVQPGDSFWSLASDAVTAELGRPATTAEITSYWASLMAANTDQLMEPGNPDLIHPGQVFDLPPV